MTQHPTHSPLAHESGRSTLEPGSDRVDDEYVFAVVVDESGRFDEQHPVTHSIRVDPTDGDEGALVLQVTTRAQQRSRSAVEKSFTVTITAPGLGDPPRAGPLESTLETWFHQHYDPGTSELIGPRADRRIVTGRDDQSPSHSLSL